MVRPVLHELIKLISIENIVNLSISRNDFSESDSSQLISMMSRNYKHVQSFTARQFNFKTSDINLKRVRTFLGQLNALKLLDCFFFEWNYAIVSCELSKLDFLRLFLLQLPRSRYNARQCLSSAWSLTHKRIWALS